MADPREADSAQFGTPYIETLIRQTEAENGLFMEERYLAPVLNEDLAPLTDLEVLEVGCGILINTKRILKLKPRRVRAIDISEEMLRVAESRLPAVIAELGHKPNIRFRQMSGDDLTYETNRFDVATSVFVVENMPDPVLIKHFGEMYRVLKPGGRYVMAGLDPLWLLLVSGGGAQKPEHWPERFRNFDLPHTVIVEQTDAHKYTRNYRCSEWYLTEAMRAGLRLAKIRVICVPNDEAELAHVPEKYHPKRGWPLFWSVVLEKPNGKG